MLTLDTSDRFIRASMDKFKQYNQLKENFTTLIGPLGDALDDNMIPIPSAEITS